jgi:hypothetical protein
MIPDEISDAAVNGDKDAVVEWLAEHPQSVNDVDAQGASLLIRCIENDDNQDTHPELVRYLLSRGADPNRIWVSNFGGGTMTALFSVCGDNDFPELQQLVACLLRAGADPNLKISSDEGGSGAAPLSAAIEYLLSVNNGSRQLPVVVRLLRAGASLDDCDDGLTAEDIIAAEEQLWPQLANNNNYFQAAKTLIRGVRAAGSWKKYCRRRGPHRGILRLRSFVVRGRATTSDKWLAGMVRLKENGLVWNILSFWRDPDDIEDIVLHGGEFDGDVVRVYD